MNITNKEARKLYNEGNEEKLIEEIFGDFANIFNFELFKVKVRWGENPNDLKELLDLADMLVANSEGKTTEQAQKIFDQILEGSEYFV